MRLWLSGKTLLTIGKHKNKVVKVQGWEVAVFFFRNRS